MSIYDDLIPKKPKVKKEGFLKKAARFLLPQPIENDVLGKEPTTTETTPQPQNAGIYSDLVSGGSKTTETFPTPSLSSKPTDNTPIIPLSKFLKDNGIENPKWTELEKQGKITPELKQLRDLGFNPPKTIPKIQEQLGLPYTEISTAPPQKPKSTWQKFLDTIEKPFVRSAVEEKGRDMAVESVYNTINNNYYNQIAKKLNKTPDWVKQNIYNIKDSSGKPVPKEAVSWDDIDNHLDKYTKALGVRTNPTPMEFVGDLFTLPIVGGLLTDPITTGLGVAAYSALSKGENILIKKIKPQAENLSDLLPRQANDLSRNIVDLLDVLWKGKALHLAYQKSPELLEKFTKQAITTYHLPEKVYFDGDKIKDIFQTGKKLNKDELKMITDLGLNAEQYKDAIKHGLTIEVPMTKVVTLADKPYWAKLKEILRVKPTKPNVRIFRVGETKQVPSIKGLLPEGQPETYSTPPLEQMPSSNATPSQTPPVEQTPIIPQTSPVEQNTTQPQTPTETPLQQEGILTTPAGKELLDNNPSPLTLEFINWFKKTKPEYIDKAKLSTFADGEPYFFVPGADGSQITLRDFLKTKKPEITPKNTKEVKTKEGLTETKPTITEIPKEKSMKTISAKRMFKVGDVLDTNGKSNMANPVKIVKIEGNTPTLVDANGQSFTGQSLSTIKRLVDSGSWKKIEKTPVETKIPKELEPKTEPLVGGKGIIPPDIIPKGKISWRKVFVNKDRNALTKNSFGTVFWQIKGDVPDEVKKLKSVKFRDDKIPQTIEEVVGEANNPLSVIGTGRMKDPNADLIVLDNNIVVDKKYFNILAKKFPTAKLYNRKGEKESPIVFKVNNKVVATVMPIRLDASEIKDFTRLTKAGNGVIKEYGQPKVKNIGSGTRPEELSNPTEVGEEPSGHIQKTNKGGSGSVARGGHNISVSGNGERSGTLNNRRLSNQEIEELVKSKDTFTDEEKKQLAQYTGSGGMEHQGAEGRGLLDEYYTPKAVVNLTWNLVKPFFPTGKKLTILEPSIGIGSFLVGVPKDSEVYGMEINPVSYKIAKVLYPNAKIANKPFERLFIDERGDKINITNRFNLVIGNPPYGQHRGKYKGLGEESKISKYEEYFLKRALDLARDPMHGIPEGYVAFVMPSRFLQSNMSGYAKREIAEMGELVEARRLPNGVFPTTDIGTDIVVFRKDPLDVKEYTYQARLEKISNDEYFKEHPEYILGEQSKRKGRFGEETYVKGTLADLENGMNVKNDIELVKNFPETARATLMDDIKNKAEKDIYIRKVWIDKLEDGKEQIIAEVETQSSMGEKYGSIYTADGDSISDIANEIIDEFPAKKETPIEKANRIKAEKALEKKENFGGEIGIKTRKEFIQYAINKGWTPKIEKEIDKKAVEKAKEEKRDLTRRLYGGHNNGEQNAFLRKEIAKLEDTIAHPPTKNNYIIEKPDESFYVITKTEYDYAQSINTKKEIDGREVSTSIGEEGEPDQGLATPDVKTTKDVNEKVIIKKKKGETEKIKENVDEKEMYLWKNTLATGELSKEAVDKMKDNTPYINFYLGNWYNNFNYFQGNVYLKLRNLEAEKSLMSPEQYDKQKRGLEAIIPKKKTIRDITLLPNSDFAKDIKIGDDKLIDLFKEYLNDLPYEAFKSSSRYEILEYISGSIVNRGDKKLNIEIRKRRRKIGDELFNKFLEEELTPEQQKVIEDEYNKTFNNYVRPDYTQVPLTSPIGKTFKGKPLKIRHIQLEGAGFLANKGVGLLGYGTGVGKTLTSILAVNEVMGRGWAKRPLFIVPSGVYNKWISEIKDVMPGVTINSLVNLGSKFKGDLKTLEIGEKTLSIITYEGMTKLGFKDETYQKLLADLQDVMSGVNTTKRGEAKEKQKVAEVIGTAARQTTTDKYFEDLGFDLVVFDEVQNFKNIFSGAKMAGKTNEYRNVKGASSVRGIKAYIMSQYVLGQNNGRGVFGLSATPFTNSPMEIYSILSLFAKRKMEQMGIKNVNDFMTMFMKLTPRFQVKANQKVIEEDVIEDFHNLGELQRLVGEYIDFRTAEEAGIPTPTKQKKTIILKPNKAQVDFLDQSQEIYTDKDKGGAIAAISEQQNITLSPYLSRYYNGAKPTYKQFVENSPKIYQAIKTIKQIKKDNPEVGQIIYMPRGIEYIPLVKEYLVKEIGYKPSEVAEIKGGMAMSKKQDIKDKFNEGKIKVLIGTETVKEGVDLQDNATELHHLHLPWNPTDIQQVEGRIHRQGNQWKNVRIHYYLIENSVDQFIFQKLETKEKRIKNVWSYTGNKIEVGDLNFEDMKLDLITDPVVKVKAENTFLKAKEQARLETLEAEKVFIGRKYKKIDDLKESLKENAETIKMFSDPNYDKSYLREAKRKQKNILQALNQAKERLQGVNVSELKKQAKNKQKEINVQEKRIEKIDEGYKEKLAEAKKQLVEHPIIPNDYSFYPKQIAQEDKTFFKKTEDKSINKPMGSVGGNASVGKFRDGTEIKMGGVDKIRPVEFPELVEFAKILSGNVPGVTNRFRKALGRFYAIEKGRIKLNADLFKQENLTQLAKTLAHEIGHLIDYLPHKLLKRGNILGSLYSLRHFLKGTFGDITIKNSEVRKELKAVSKYWRPWDEEKATQGFKNYRNSSRELYADAISVLLNSPGTLEEMAPTFYDTFFEQLDRKPAVRDAYFDLQEILSHDRKTLIELRRKKVRQMFSDADYKARDLQKIKEDERKLRSKDFWEKFKYEVMSVNSPIYDRVNRLEKQGIHIPDDENPKYLLSGRNYLSGKIKGMFEYSVMPIRDTLEENDIDWKTFGEFLFYERVLSGDRSNFANPGGITPPVAEELLKDIETSLGVNKFEVLRDSADKFRGFLKDIATDAYNVGLFSDEMFDIINGNSKYVPYQVLEYMEDNVAWKSKSQVGTLKDINNPANSLLLKTISTIKAIEQQKIKTSIFKMLKDYYPDDIQEAKYVFNGKTRVPIESRDRHYKLIPYYEKGKLKGKYVDPYIAGSINNDSITRNRAVMTILSPLSITNAKLFRPLFVVFSPGFIAFNLMKDFWRFWKAIPDMSILSAAKRYKRALRVAKVRAFTSREKLRNASDKDKAAFNIVNKLEKEGILSVTWNDILLGETTEDSQIRSILEKMSIIEKKPYIPHPLLKPFINTLEFIKKTGDLVETLPKVAGYFELQNKMTPQETRWFITKNIGSPDFSEKGHLTPVTNNIFLFSNAIIQAITADLHIMTDPQTRSGYWWKTAKSTVLPKILMLLAALGVFGAEIKKIMDSASEYDKANYNIIPLGTDNGKGVYLRIPMDETGRLIGAIAWKMMTAPTNHQGVGKDVTDIAALFSGQLPTVAPLLTSGFATNQFISGQNPYDFFRGRNVLTDTQAKAGGWYAVKPFLLWQWDELGGSIFMKFYAGQQSPIRKSPGEKFLQSPFISNLLGRFIKITDYGRLQKAREMLQGIEQERARRSLDEKEIINKYVGKYQQGGNIYKLENKMEKEIIGHYPAGKKEMSKAKRLDKKFEIAIQKGESDPVVNSIIEAQTNDEKLLLLADAKNSMNNKDFAKLKDLLLKNRIVNPSLFLQLK